MKKFWLILLMLLALTGAAMAEETTEYTCGFTRYVLLEDGTAMITGYDGNAESLVIPGRLDAYLVTAIGERAFFECTSLTSVTVPESVKSIGDFAFESCSSLMTVTLPQSLRTIGHNPFADCDVLRYLVVPAHHPVFAVVKGVLFDKAENRLIYYPSVYESASYTVPEGTAVIGDLAFYGCRSLTEIKLPQSVTAIGESAFESCSALRTIALPEGISEVPARAFAWCISLAEITLPESVTAIGNEAFIFCRRLAAVTMPQSVTTIAEDAFEWCPLLP